MQVSITIKNAELARQKAQSNGLSLSAYVSMLVARDLMDLVKETVVERRKTAIKTPEHLATFFDETFMRGDRGISTAKVFKIYNEWANEKSLDACGFMSFAKSMRKHCGKGYLVDENGKRVRGYLLDMKTPTI